MVKAVFGNFEAMEKTSTVGAVAAVYRKALEREHGPAETRAIVRAVFEGRVGLPVPELAPERLLTPQEQDGLQHILERLLKGEPLQYILGEVGFMGLRIGVDPRVLIPRPETEELVHRVIKSHTDPPQKVVDIGTGSGCIALALKKAWPKTWVLGLDVSEGALAVAKENGLRNGLAVEWHSADALGPGLVPLLRPDFPGQRVLLISNPPYVPLGDRAAMAEQVLAHEPHQALFVEDDDPQRFYRAIAKAADHALEDACEIWFEVHHLHATATAELMAGAGFVVELLRDISGNYRFVRARG